MKYKVKSGEIDAFQYKGDLKNSDGSYCVPEWASSAFEQGVLYHREDGKLFLQNKDSNDQFYVGVGDFVVRFPDGNIFPTTEENFHDNYDSVPKNHIERMEVEASELQAKIDGAQKFLESIEDENGPMLCDEQFELLEKQLKFMKDYLVALRRRIEFDKEMFNAIGVKD